MTQTKSQRAWYVKNRERILVNHAIHVRKEQDKRKRTLICPACKKEFTTSDSRIKYCENVECKKIANHNRGVKFRDLNKEYLQSYYQEYDMVNRELRKLTGRKGHLRRKYGITPEDYERMFLEQGGKCAICKKEKKVLHVDHNHETKKVRSLLCHHCNAGLGHFYENIHVLHRAIEYLINHED